MAILYLSQTRKSPFTDYLGKEGRQRYTHIFRRQSGSRGGGCPAVANRASNQQQQPGIGLEHSPYSPAPSASSTSATLAAAGGGQIIESVQTDTSQIVQDATVVGSQGNIVYVTVPSPI